MTVIRPNSITGITSITAQANEINVFRSNGLIAGLNLNGVNFNTTAGISTLAALKVTGNVDIAGVLTYQDVTNVDSLGIGTFRTGINVSGGQLDVGSNIKLGNAGVITATSFVGSGANLTGLNSDLVNDSSPQLGGDLDTNSHNILVDDAHAIKFGASTDLQIYHNGNSIIENTNNSCDFRIISDAIELKGRSADEMMLKGVVNGAVELYCDNSKRLYTRSNGVTIQGNSGGAGIDFSTDTTHRGTVYFDNTNKLHLYDSQGHDLITGLKDGAVELYHDGSQEFKTTSYGISIGENTAGLISGQAGIEIGKGHTTSELRLKNSSGGSGQGDGFGVQKWNDGNTYIYEYDPNNFVIGTNGTGRWIIGGTSGNLIPYSNNAYDIGTTSTRVKNIYTNDLHLSNEGSTNSVDNTWGDYTIQEGESDLYLINNRNGKKYKFNLTEVN